MLFKVCLDPLTRSFRAPVAAYEWNCNGCRSDAVGGHGGVDDRQRLHHHGDGLQLAHLAGHADRGDCMYDMQDLLAPGALRGQDGARREDLGRQEEEASLTPLTLTHCCAASPLKVGVCGYHRAY